MDIYATTVADLPEHWRAKIRVVPDRAALNRLLAREFGDLLAAATTEGRLLTAICPVGPLDYEYFANEVLRRGLSCENLRTINMDEYLDGRDRWIPVSHPLSFRRFMEETFFGRLPVELRPLPENVLFPNPDDPGQITRLIDEIGGADICWGGFGITGHVAFNDPPAMLGEPQDLASFRNCRTRKLTISPMSTAQMLMGGTNGNAAVLPKRAVTIGMYELLKSKHYHCTFMRNWHAGLWRRALLGPVTPEFPGSLLQKHPNLTITMTELAAAVPLVHTAQATGEADEARE
ncbi:MAG: glucosamine-6-phosphate isomerase [Lentisphaeria bacterium]|jgi:glucosamine-6-phosphate deaminase|nr:glucosamine-6-phosphate isomerase [Lentisphaeria bacterium]